MSRAGTYVTRVVGCTGRDEEAVAGLQGEGGPPVDGRLHRPGDDVPDFFTGMGVCQPDSTPTGISVNTCTMSRPGIEDGLCWISVRLSLLARASRGGCGLAAGYVTKISLNQAAAVLAAGQSREAGVCHAARNDGRDRDRRQSGQPLLSLLVRR